MDDTRGCCKFCGKDLEPGQTCTDCQAGGAAPGNSSLEETSLPQSAQSLLLNVETRQKIVVDASPWGIGRHRSNEFCLDDPHVSRFHARITREDNVFHIEDLGSTNGTVVNGQDLTTRRQLKHGDKIRIGKGEFIFVMPAAGEEL